MQANRFADIASTRSTTPAQSYGRRRVGPPSWHRSLGERGLGRRIARPRDLWALMLLSALLLTGAKYQPSAILHTNPQETRLAVGDTTTVDLMLADVRGLYGAEIHLRFDPKALQVVDAAPGTDGVQLEPGILPVPDFVVQNEADNSQGTIDYAVTQLPPSKPGEGSGVVARITFQAIKPSISSLRFEQFLLADTIGGNIEALPQDGQIRVQNRSAWILYAVIGLALLSIVGGAGYLVTRTSVRQRK